MNSPGTLRFLLVCQFMSSIFFLVNGQIDTTVVTKVPAVQYTEKGFAFTSPDSNYQMHIEWRGQFRIAYPTDSDPVNLEDLDQDKVHIKVNRARMKVGGHAYKPYFKYYLEYELFAGNLLDFRVM